MWRKGEKGELTSENLKKFKEMWRTRENMRYMKKQKVKWRSAKINRQVLGAKREKCKETWTNVRKHEEVWKIWRQVEIH